MTLLRTSGARAGLTNEFFSGRAFRLAIAAEMLVAAALALPVAGRTFWRDETFSAVVAQQPLDTVWQIVLNREAGMAPYLVFLHFWMTLGDSELWLRLPSIAFAVAAVPMTALVARRVFDNQVAVVAGLLTAVSALTIGFAVEARTYSLVVLLAAVATHLLLVAAERGGAGRWAGYVVAAALLIAVHPLSVLVVVAHGVSLPALPAAAARPPALAVLAALLAGSPALVHVASIGDLTSWIPATTLRTVAGFLTHYGGGHLSAVVWLALATFAVTIIASSAHRTGRPRTNWPRLLVASWLVVPPVLLAVASLVRPMFVDRYLAGVFPALAILVAFGVTQLRGLVRPVGLTVLVITSLVGVVLRVHAEAPADAPRDAAGAVATCARAGDAVAYVRPFARAPMDFYLRQSPAAALVEDVAVQPGGRTTDVGDLFPRELPAAALRDALARHDRVWLVDYPGDDWKPTPEPTRELVDTGFFAAWPQVGTARFGELQVQLLSRADSPGCPGLTS